MRKLLIVAGLALFAFPAVASAQNDVARGSGFTFGSFPSEFSFNAQSNFNGTEASGSVSFTNTNTDPNQTYKGRVTCLQVIGNQATMSGDITDIQGFPVFTGPTAFVLRATDTGKFGTAPDMVDYFLLFGAPPPPAPSCLAGFTLFPFPIQSGEIVIKDSNT